MMIYKNILFFMGCLMWFLSAVKAQTVRYVSTTGETSWQNAIQATSWQTACPDLQAVINASAFGDEIWVAAGIYLPSHSAVNWTTTNPTEMNSNANDRNNAFVLKDGVKIYGGFIIGATDMSHRNIRNNITVLSGNLGNINQISDNAYHVVVASGLTNASLLDGFVIIGGNANGNTNVQINGQVISTRTGGGVACVGGSMTLQNCFIQDNQTLPATDAQNGGVGGGMYNLNASPELINVYIRGCSAGTGGGMGNHQSSIQLTNVQISGNYGSNGGAMSLTFGSAIFTNITVSGNFSIDPLSSIFAMGSTVTAYNSIIWGNSGNAAIAGAQLTAVHSLVEGINFQTSDPLNINGNLDGSTVDNNPLFVLPIPYENAPDISGNYRLMQGSPCINAGINDTNKIATDIAGLQRVVDDTIDIGAFENLAWDTIPDDDIVIPQISDIGIFDIIHTTQYLKIYPNPVSVLCPKITIESDSVAGNLIEIYNIAGQKIQQTLAISSPFQLTLPDKRGIYLLKMNHILKTIIIQ